MPKERIPTPTGPYEVNVGWNQHGGVQVGVVGNEGRSIFWLLFGHDPAMARLDDAINTSMSERGKIDAEGLLNILDCVGAHEGLWSDLDRHGCNQLIRTLRRARDAAFGRDE